MELGLNCGTGFSGFKSIAIKLESGSRFLRIRIGTGVFEKKEIWFALTQAFILYIITTVCLSVRPGADLGFRTSTDEQDQVLKSRS
jgi:hypothetical protein